MGTNTVALYTDSHWVDMTWGSPVLTTHWLSQITCTSIPAMAMNLSPFQGFPYHKTIFQKSSHSIVTQISHQALHIKHFTLPLQFLGYWCGQYIANPIHAHFMVPILADFKMNANFQTKCTYAQKLHRRNTKFTMHHPSQHRPYQKGEPYHSLHTQTF